MHDGLDGELLLDLRELASAGFLVVDCVGELSHILEIVRLLGVKLCGDGLRHGDS